MKLEDTRGFLVSIEAMVASKPEFDELTKTLLFLDAFRRAQVADLRSSRGLLRKFSLSTAIASINATMRLVQKARREAGSEKRFY